MDKNIDININMSQNKTIELPGYYIVRRHDKTGTREQYVKLESVSKGRNGQTIYSGYYGYQRYHEINCKLEQVRALNEKELLDHQEGKYWDLPQQFYQTISMY